MKLLLLVGSAGGAGTLLRYACVRSVHHLLPGFPWGTLAVNVAGAFPADFFFVPCRLKFQHYEAYFPLSKAHDSASTPNTESFCAT